MVNKGFHKVLLKCVITFEISEGGRCPFSSKSAPLVAAPINQRAHSFVTTDGRMAPCFKSGHPTAPPSLQIL